MADNIEMKSFSMMVLCLIPVLVLAGCASIGPAMQSIQPTSSPTIPASDSETIQLLLKEPMNCAVPCFWGVIPGKTPLDEARVFFNHLGFTSREGKNFYSTGYKSDSGDSFAVIFHTSGPIIESIIITPDTLAPNEGSHREWIAYSPETLIKRYGSPSRVEFAVGSGQNIGISMIMYFDSSGLIVHYSGYNMTPESFCPLTDPFDHVRLWMGDNPPDTPSFETISLEDATSLTMDQFTQLMLGDPKKACFSVKGEVAQ